MPLYEDDNEGGLRRPLQPQKQPLFWGGPITVTSPHQHHHGGQRPLVKYHLIQQSYPLRKGQPPPAYYEDYLPSLAYIPGPPYHGQSQAQTQYLP